MPCTHKTVSFVPNTLWNKPPPTEKLDSFSFGRFLTNYDVTRVERKTAELTVINFDVQKRAQNREKITKGDYYCFTRFFPNSERLGNRGVLVNKLCILLTERSSLQYTYCTTTRTLTNIFLHHKYYQAQILICRPDVSFLPQILDEL